ncbi:MAG: hypothetical protein KDC44_24540, partial [Phaeodactylibacter sp.]|nr:hypothetical protein [Phaeodactylibacter sp.]
PVRVFKDDWNIAGCPVNGPAIQAAGQDVAVAWYSMPQDSPTVKVAFSIDSGATFSKPIRVDEGQPLGRVDLVLLSDDEVLVSWIEQVGDRALIKAVRVNRIGTIGHRFVLSESDASRKSGFPVLAKRDKQLIVAWTEVDSLTRVQSAILDLNQIH